MGHLAYVCSVSPHGGLPNQINRKTDKTSKNRANIQIQRAEFQRFWELPLKVLAFSEAEI